MVGPLQVRRLLHSRHDQLLLGRVQGTDGRWRSVVLQRHSVEAQRREVLLRISLKVTSERSVGI